MKIVVLAGGLSPERNVSLSTGTMVTQALRALGHRAGLLDMYFGLEDGTGAPENFFDAAVSDTGRSIRRDAPDLAKIRESRRWQSKSMFGPGVLELCAEADLVFLALHGTCGEDGRVQATFDLLGIPYTGSGFLGSAIAMDKDLTKRMVAGIVATPAWQVQRYGKAEIRRMAARTRLPCVVKPVASGSSIGVAIARTPEELAAALEENLLQESSRVVLEQYVSGREIQVGVLAGEALPSIEIITQSGFYDYNHKYQPGAAREVCPADIPSETEREVRQAAIRVYHALGLSVYARADFILDEFGDIWFLEINTLPGMTPTSLLPQEAAAVGIDYQELCGRIIEASLAAREQER
ncbi:MAG: D-alanine--D-alanine ligase [Oscillospiraceae bacterium]|nr:D-alanine--D-alanine ligase [Oscillospiraceae bacterium]